jgi:hypothetical protein
MVVEFELEFGSQLDFGGCGHVKAPVEIGL